MTTPKNIALVMTGGGARGAYQAGVLKRVSEIRGIAHGHSPFRLVSGASAGALNATVVAAGSTQFRRFVDKLSRVWSDVQAEDVYRTDLKAMGAIAGRWVRDLSFGGAFGGGLAQSLLDASPLRGFLQEHIHFHEIQNCIDRGHLHSLSITATSYNSGKSYIFVQGIPGLKMWRKTRRVALATPITVDHVCASAAIPLVFQAVKLKTEVGELHFGDGCLRLTTPLSPAIRLGAEKIFAIGVRSLRASEAAMKNLEFGTDGMKFRDGPPLARVIGVLFNAIFLDYLETDIDHLERMNELIDLLPESSRKMEGMSEPLRKVEPFSITPSQDLAKIAESFSTRMPKMVSYMLKGLTDEPEHSADLISYLLFHPDFTRALIEIGYKDASERIDEIEAFLRS
jgi:NTE family protein